MTLKPLRAAIEDLTTSFPEEYARGAEFIDRLFGYEEALSGRGTAGEEERDASAIARLQGEIETLRRQALTANPLVSTTPILFVVRHQYKPDHHNTATIFQKGEINTASFTGGSALKTIDFGKGGETKTLLECPEGVIRDPEVHFSGEKIVFSMRKEIDDDYHIYEIGSDGAGLRQLTSAKGVSDIDPLYLPDGTIFFSSTREPKYCMCNRHIMANLFRMEADGANIHQVAKSTLFEGHSSLLPDGRVLYDRWEYVDRNFGDAQGLWTVNPDGANPALYWGNNTPSPGAVIDARAIPGTQLALCVFGSCHDRPWGALAIVDRGLGVDGKKPIVHIWPADALGLVKDATPGMPYAIDDFKRANPKYEDPFPLNDKSFLCSRMTGHGEQMGIYLIDVFGNEILLHTEEPGCFDPMPLAPRPRPPVIPSRRDYRNAEGVFYVADVYRGTHMQGVERGSVKALRVVESPEKRSWTQPCWMGQGTIAPAMNWHDFNNKRILGTVPVEEDGSAHFSVPSDTFVYFQLLDENGMMIQSMRSGTMVQSGEVTGCVGCHEERRSAPPPSTGEILLALGREPSQLHGWYGPPRPFSYMAEVQPVFDRHCVKCHDFGEEGAAKLNLAPDRDLVFNVSYNELWRKRYVRVIGAGPVEIQSPCSWGSHVSKLAEILRNGHQDLSLDPESLDRVITWIDINAPYYPTYDSAYPENLGGRSPLNNEQIQRLSLLTGVPFDKQLSCDANPGPQISFDRPERSPCLSTLKNASDASYVEALEIVRAGKETLASRPRADMPGFQACPVDRDREERYCRRESIEIENREAIRSEGKAYD